MSTHYDRLIFVGKVKVPSKEKGSGSSLTTRLLVMTYTSSSLFRDNGASALRFAFLGQSGQGKALSLLGSALEPNNTPECYFPIGYNLTVHKIDQNDPGIEEYLTKLTLMRSKSEVVYIIRYSREAQIFPIILTDEEAGEKFHTAIVTQQICHQYYQQIAPNLEFVQCLATGVARSSFEIDPNCLSAKEGLELKIWTEVIKQASNDAEKIQIILKFRLVDKISIGYFYQILPPDILESTVNSLRIKGCSVNDRTLHDFFIHLSKDANMIFAPLKLIELKHLNLSENELTDLCFQTLSPLICGAPNLRSLNLSKNKITLNHQKQMFEGNNFSRLSVSPSVSPPKSFRMSKGSRLSSSSSSLQNNTSDLIIMFLHSLQHKIDLYLHGNLIKDPSLICEYIIEAFNVPLRYLSIGGNKFLEVDRIKMAKVQMRTIQQRSGTSQEYCLVDVGAVHVVDFEVEQYVQLVRDSQVKWGLKPKQNRRTVRIQANPEWEICNEAGIFQDLELSKKATSPIRAKNRTRLLSMASNPMSESSPSNNDTEEIEVNENNLHQILEKLRTAYSQDNYSGVRVYKEMLKQYNQQIFESKIKPMFQTEEKKIIREQEQILAILRDLVNYQGISSQMDYNRKLDLVLSKMLRKRIDYTLQAGFASLSEECFVEGLLGVDLSWNAFLFLLFLKEQRDEKIENMIKNQFNPLTEVYTKSLLSKNFYESYYVSQLDAHTHDNFACLLQEAMKLEDRILSFENYEKIQKPIPKNAINNKQRALNEACKMQYLLGAGKQVNFDEQYLAMLDPKMQPLRYLLLSPLRAQDNLTKVRINFKIPPIPSSIISDVPNMLEYLSKNEVLKFYPFSQQVKDAGISAYEGPKYCELHSLTPEEQIIMTNHCGIVINFLKFLYHSPDNIMAEAVQYLHYIIHSTLEAAANLKTPLADEFYIQLLTFPPKKLSNGILCSVVEITSLYLSHSAQMEPFIISHLLKNQAHPIEFIRLLRHSQTRFTHHEQLLEQQSLLSFLRISVQSLPTSAVPSILSQNMDFYVMQSENFSHNVNEFYLTKLSLQVHLLDPISSILQKAVSEYGKKVNRQIPQIQRFALFLYNRQDEKCQILLPTHCQTAYELFHKEMLSNEVCLVLKPWYSSIQPFQQSKETYTQEDWIVRYLQVRQCFREHGSLLGNEGYGSLINSISWCMVCEILFQRTQDLLRLKDKNVEGEEHATLNEILADFLSRIDENTPKGTSISLTAEEKLAIRDCTSSHLTPLIQNPKLSLAYPFTTELYEFQKTCKAVGLCTSISDSTSQTQFIISNLGLTYVHKIIYVTEIEWRQVYAIDVSEGDGNTPIKIMVKYSVLSSNGDNNRKKLQIVENMMTQHGKVFIRGVLILLEQAMKTLVLEPREKIIRYQCEKSLPDQNIKRTKSRIQTQPHSLGQLVGQNFWQLIMGHISNEKGSEEEHLLAVNAHENESVRSSKRNRRMSLQEEVEELRKTNPPLEIKASNMSVFDAIKASMDNGSQISRSQVRKSRHQESRQGSVSVADSMDLSMQAIVGEKHEEERETVRNTATLQIPQPQKSEQMDEPITNARRSGKRQLPKRRSSRGR